MVGNRHWFFSCAPWYVQGHNKLVLVHSLFESHFLHSRVPGRVGDMSELITAGWSQPDFLQPYEGENPGRVESFELTSKTLENSRQIHVYLPPGYDKGSERYPVLLFNDGDPWLNWANLPNSLNQLIGSHIAPIIAVFVELPPNAASDEFGGMRSTDYVNMLADELKPTSSTGGISGSIPTPVKSWPRSIGSRTTVMRSSPCPRTRRTMARAPSRRIRRIARHLLLVGTTPME